MTTIDQRILIPTGPDAVWELMSDISNNPVWQVDCKSISFLSSRRDGPGVRWRYTSKDGREYVLETTAWYDKLGYEYTFIDGAGYRESKGRIRLQEIPEGTIVQWTFTYEMPGLIAGLRNSISIKRNLENTMIESLKMLWRKSNEKRDAPREVHEAKSLMRDAPDYEQRAQYKPRHSSTLSSEEELEEHDRFRPAPPAPATKVRQEPVAQRPVIIPEPPISDEDTKPRPAVVEPPQSAPPEPEKTRVQTPPVEPDFLPSVPEMDADEESTALLPDRPDKDETKERAAEALQSLRVEMPVVPPVADEPEPIVLQQEPPSPPPIRIDEDATRDDEHAVFRPPPIPVFDNEPTESIEETVLDEPLSTEAQEDEIEEIPQSVEEADLTPTEAESVAPIAASDPVVDDKPIAETDKRSTRESAGVDPSKLETTEVSIWEIFGVPRPSETQEIAAVKIEAALQEQSQSQTLEETPPPVPGTAAPAPVEIIEPVVSKTVYPHYTGLRIKLRRSLVHLRRHQE